MGKRRPRTSAFTLMELVAVMAISAVVLGLAVTSIGKMPAFLSMETISDKVVGVLAEARNQALTQGAEARVLFYQDTRMLMTPEGNNLPGRSCPIPEGLELEFDPPQTPEEIPCFRFFPDGSGAGPLMLIKLKGHARLIRVSPLTGTAIAEEIETD